jgi:anti-anti-sigma regulatory factor
MPAVELKAGEALEISQLAGLKLKWLKSIEESKSISVQLDSVQRVDTAGLQFLIGLRKEAQSRSLDLRFDKPSEMLRKQAAILGLDIELF